VTLSADTIAELARWRRTTSRRTPDQGRILIEQTLADSFEAIQVPWWEGGRLAERDAGGCHDTTTAHNQLQRIAFPTSSDSRRCTLVSK
jgi:agmatine/peptidylarginine deiminase